MFFELNYLCLIVYGIKNKCAVPGENLLKNKSESHNIIIFIHSINSVDKTTRAKATIHID